METLQPLDDLTPECIQYLTSIGSSSKKVSQIIDHKDAKVYQAIEEGFKQFNFLVY